MMVTVHMPLSREVFWHGEEAGIITLICTKDDRILSFGTNFYDKKIMVEVIKSSKNTELLKKMLEESK